MPARILPAQDPSHYAAQSTHRSGQRAPSHGDGSDRPPAFVSPSRAPSGYSPMGPLYPTSRIPPPLQVHHYPVAPPRPHLVPVAPLGQYGMHHHPVAPQYGPHLQWLPNSHVYSAHPPHPPPPPIVHKVWILDCKACGTFFTNRGMKAVLLLRPNVPLYSTDALPVNCSAYSPAPCDATSASTSPSASASSSPGQSRQPILPRTCECLTQTLCCHGCGASVGYMIVIPCARCTSSTSGTQRATNGHRFVFYASDIDAAQRHYVAGERGVVQFHPPPLRSLHMVVGPQVAAQVQAQVRALAAQMPTSPPPPGLRFVSYGQAAAMQMLPRADQLPTPSTPPRSESDSDSDMPELETLRWTSSPPSSVPTSPSGVQRRPFAVNSAPLQIRMPPPHPPPSRVTSPTYPLSPVSPVSPTSPRSPPASLSSQPPPTVPEAEPEQTQVPLRVGDAMYWHNLVRSGEIPAVVDDERARGPPAGEVGEKGEVLVADDGKEPVAMRGGVPRGMVVGR